VGGLAGLVVATRLAEYKNVSIAMLEAGSFYEITNGNNSQVWPQTYRIHTLMPRSLSMTPSKAC